MKGGLEMINIDNLSKQILFLYKIINSMTDSWNAIGKHWLQKYDNKFGVDFLFFVNAPILKDYISHPFQNTIKTLYQHGTIIWGHILRSLKMAFNIKTYVVTLRSKEWAC
jgi:hypothetical protein